MPPPTGPLHDHPPSPPTSVVLERLPRRLPDKASVNDVLGALGERGVGAVLAIVAVPAIVPTPGVPAGLIFGTILAMLATLLLVGRGAARLPGFVGGRRMPKGLLDEVAKRGPAILRKVEAFLNPRFELIAGRRAAPWLAGVVALMGVIIALPIPFANTLPGLSVLVIGLGLGARDGVAVAAGLVLAAAAVATSIALGAAGWYAAAEAYHRWIVG